MQTDLENKKLLLQRKKELLSRRGSLAKEYGLLFYRPYVKNGFSPQDNFHRAGAFKHRLWEAGNRSGKSTGGVAEDCAWLMGERVWYPATDPARRLGIPSHPVKLLVIAQDWDKVDEIFTSERGVPGKIWQFLPRGFVKSKKRNHSGAIETVECVNGSVLRFDTVKAWTVNPMGSESSDWDAIHVDEPCPEQMFKAHSRGLIDRDGKDWFTATLLKEPWIHDKFYGSSRRQEPGSDRVYESGNKWMQRSTTYDNVTLSDESIADFESTLTAEEKQCRLLGLPLELSGLVYKEFDWNRHVLSDLPLGWSAYDEPPSSYSIYIALDPHPQTPHHVLFLAAAPTGQLFLWDELFVHCTIDDLAVKIKGKLRGRRPILSIADPLAFIEHPITGTSMIDELAKSGLYFSKASKAREHGILRVKSELKQKDRLYVSPLLEETLFEFTHYCWDERENKPKDANDHAMENLYRLCLEDPTWVDPSVWDGPSVAAETFTGCDLSLPLLTLN
jgi:hypothetical protein